MIALMISALCTAASGDPAKAVPLEILVPAYFYPSGNGLLHWNELIKSARRAPIVVILNPSSGPGHSLDPNYKKVSSRARSAGVKVLGYVSTNYSERARDRVLHDILLYRDLYQVDGFFIDEMSNSAQGPPQAYYQGLYSFIKLLDERYLVVGNPGADSAHRNSGARFADTLVTHENHGRSAHAVLTKVQSGQRTPSYRDALLAYEVEPGIKFQQIFQAATRRDTSMIYLTDNLRSPNPWDTLPSYWSDLVTLVCKHNGNKDCK